jgi:two-component system sensor histidine kinase TtrS
MIRALFIAMAIATTAVSPCSAQNAGSEVRIGVLAYLGYEDALARWHGLKRYLDASVDGHTFDIVPMTLTSASSQISAGQLDFVLTNPGHYVDLAKEHAMSVLATRNVQRSDGSYTTEFGSLIFARADSGIQTLSDGRNRTVVAIDKMAFGGFQLAWQEFENAQVNLFTDTKALIFAGFPMDNIVDQVASGQADIGIVRSGLMERILADGRYAADDFVFLNTNVTFAHPDMISTRLYPEWPFAALASVTPDLRDAVALALLRAKYSPLARDVRMRNYWSSAVAYKSAVELNLAYSKRVETPAHWQRIVDLWHVIATGIATMGALGAIWLRHRPARAVGPTLSATQDPASASAHPNLTKRERQVLDLIAKGLSSKEIAQSLKISPKTVEFHRANLLKKFEARSSTQLVALAT